MAIDGKVDAMRILAAALLAAVTVSGCSAYGSAPPTVSTASSAQHALGTGNGITTYALANINAFPTSIASGADGNVWVTEWQGATIAKVTPLGVITEFPMHELPFQIVRGPGKTLWFTTTRINRITTSGIIKRFSLPAGDCAKEYLTEGPDKNIWFTDSCSDKIGKMTPTGALTEYSIPLQGNGSPTGITSGPDGNLWFTVTGQSSDTRIGKISTAGVVTEYGPNGMDGADQIIAGPDGNMYATDYFANALVQVTMAGTITLFTMPQASFNPVSLAVGPDGRIWVMAEHRDLTRFDLTTHTFSANIVIPEIDNRAPSGLKGITLGPDGDMWFTGGESPYVGSIL